MNPVTFPILFGLISALTYGAADFTGGMVAKRTNTYGIVILGHIGSLVLLTICALALRESLPGLKDWLIGMLAGVSGCAGLVLLYRSLADGQMSLVSPVSALVGAGVPVLVGVFTEGLPGKWMLVGFVLALVAIWLIAQTGKISLVNILARIRLPVLSGVCFGFFFVGIHFASSQSIVWPLVATRLGSIPSLLLFTHLTHQTWLPERKYWKSIGLISLLDSAGNVFYSLASQLGRLDLAAVLVSLYPGSTVVLARLILKEKVTWIQWVGILLALVALACISK